MPLDVNTLLSNISQVLSSGSNDFGSLHPLIVHFPIALLFVVPLFIILGIIMVKQQKTLMLSAFILLLLGTASLLGAYLSGEKASETIETQVPAIIETLDKHDTLAHQSRNIFLTLLIIFLGLYIYSNVKNLFGSPQIILFYSIFLIAYVFALLILSNTAHYGGELVHKHYIHSNLFQK